MNSSSLQIATECDSEQKRESRKCGIHLSFFFLLLSFFHLSFFLYLVTLSFSLPPVTSFDCEGCTPKSISGLLVVCVVYRDNIGRRVGRMAKERGRENDEREGESRRVSERRTCDEVKKDSVREKD